MISEEDIKNIKEDLEIIRDTQTKGVYNSYRIDQAIEYIEQLENKIKDIEKERDYYKQRYLEFNDAFLKVNINMEEMLKELKRSKLYERSTNE